ncbi:Rho-type gtpase-activating protein [Mucor velutinosus]|uniref:Rho-type gtpase-activating protein n=1 Tax=Mucor velutinosus TaxID=708070 RepID=A0AAN7DGC2_9FUNG|nr:Rho-type gtpase-activating protein [Mucor velutinosus]
MSHPLHHQMSLISLHFQTWTPDHEEDSFSKNLLDQFDQKMDQDQNSHLVMDQSDINMSDTTYEEDEDERNFSSIASSQHLNDINRTSILTSTSSFKIKEHENPTIPAALQLPSRSSDHLSHSHHNRKKKKQNILKKSSMFFSEKIIKKKSTLFTKAPPPATPTTTTTAAPHDRLKRSLDQKKRSSPGITIKSQPQPQPQQPSSNVKLTPWWRRLNNYLIPRDDAR